MRFLALLNGRKERSRTTSRKEDDGLRSGTVSRCHSPSSVKEVRKISIFYAL